MKRFIFIFCLFYFNVAIGEYKFLDLSLPVSGKITRANLLYLSYDFKPKGFLILASGYNSDGSIIKQKEWINFSYRHQLILVGLSFSSRIEDLRNGNGYYYASKGSGKLLLDGLKQIYPIDLPIYLYGFSGGAHFVSRLAEWIPGKIGGFCAYSAAWWDKPTYLKNPPKGIIACGEKDERLGASLSYFLYGRKVNRQWTWCRVFNANHAQSAKFEDFVRNYFESIISKLNKMDVWIDITNGQVVSTNISVLKPALTCYLPSIELLDEWKSLNGVK